MHSLSIFPEISITITTRSDGPISSTDDLLVTESGLGSKKILLPTHEHWTNTVFVDNDIQGPVSGDIVVSQNSQVAIAHLFADCVPLIIVDRAKKAYVFSHLGWKGLVQGGVQVSLFALLSILTSDTRNLWAWVGPCIGPSSYKQTSLPLQAGLSSWNSVINEEMTQAGTVWTIDLSGFVVKELLRIGLPEDHIISDTRDTYKEAEIFFSHRRWLETKNPVDAGNFAIICSLIDS